VIAMLTRTQLADILDALSGARDLLDGQIDVVDGDYGEPAPNRAMTVCAHIDEAMAHLIREFDATPAQPFPATAAIGS
jgi:hypothetical protein